MPEVEFHTGIVDPVDFVSRMLRKAYRQGIRVLVVAPQQRLDQIDRSLWQLDERDFIPHAQVAQLEAAAAALTPIWLATEATTQHPNPPAVIINAGAAVPANAGTAQRLIEVVAAAPDDAAQGRENWRRYAAQGLSLKHLPAA